MWWKIYLIIAAIGWVFNSFYICKYDMKDLGQNSWLIKVLTLFLMIFMWLLWLPLYLYKLVKR